jgi:hypothetical protein
MKRVCVCVCVCVVTSDSNMAGRHHNGSITALEDHIGGRGSNEFSEFSSLDSTSVNEDAETEGTVVVRKCDGSKSYSTVTNKMCRYVSSVIIATGYGPDGPGIESWWR